MDVNDGNVYGRNFEGSFCRCGREYDPATERETMVQCLSCEVRLTSLDASYLGVLTRNM